MVVDGNVVIEDVNVIKNVEITRIRGHLQGY